jgi:hypothetical protein
MTVQSFRPAYSAAEAGQPHVHAVRDECAQHSTVKKREEATRVTRLIRRICLWIKNVGY